jgi:hypothetical protein
VLPSLEVLAHMAAQQFGAVFDEQVTKVDSLGALRALAASSTPPQFPAEDTPLQLPAELERLHSPADRPIRA